MNASISTTTPLRTQQPRRRTTRQIAFLQQKGHVAAGEEPGLGVRLDRMWAAKGAWQRTNAQVVDAIEHMHSRRSKPMTDSDAGLVAELEARAWNVREAMAVRYRVWPTWLCDMVPSRRSAGYVQFLGLVLGAFRAGACGLLLSYPQAMGLVGVGSEETWRRWCREWEDAGLLRITQTWVKDPVGEYQRIHGRLLYRLGPALDKHTLALLEGAIDGDGTTARDARQAAARERRAQRSRARTCMREIYRRREGGNDPRRVPEGSPRARVNPPELDEITIVADGIHDAQELRLCRQETTLGVECSQTAGRTPLSTSIIATFSPTLRDGGKFTAPGGAAKKVSTARSRSTHRKRPDKPGRCDPRRVIREVMAHVRDGQASPGDASAPVKDPSSTSTSSVGHAQPDSPAAKAGVRGEDPANHEPRPGERSAKLDKAKQSLLELYHRTALDPRSFFVSCLGLGMSPDEAHAERRLFVRCQRESATGPAKVPPAGAAPPQQTSIVELLEQFGSHLRDPNKHGKKFFFPDADG